MATYPYSVPGVDLARLQQECVAAGLPVESVNGGAIGSPDVYVNTTRDLTTSEMSDLDDVVILHDGRPRRPRPALAILADILALTNLQKTAIGDDLFGPGQKWAADVGPNRGALFVYYTLTQLGLAAGQLNTAKTHAAALYAQDNPKYLVFPSFAPAVNIPGDEPIAAPAP